MREEFGEKAGELADHGSGDMGARPQGSLSTSLSSAERWLSGGLWTLRVPKYSLPHRKGTILKSCMLCSSITKIPYSLYKFLFHGITLEQSASRNGNIATYTTGRKQLKKPKQTIYSKQQRFSPVSMMYKWYWLFLITFVFLLPNFMASS